MMRIQEQVGIGRRDVGCELLAPASFSLTDCRRLMVAVIFVALVMHGTVFAQGNPEIGVSIRGQVVDSGHHAQVEANVRLQPEGSSGSMETKTDASGGFVFSALQAGSYRLSAEKAEKRSGVIEVQASAVESKLVELMLDGAAGTGQNATTEMEFADKPNFTVAGITDWTAVGGHGSDSILRTSETLAKDTLVLKPDAGVAGSVDKSKAGSGGDARPNDQAVALSQVRASIASGDFVAARLQVKGMMAKQPSAELYRIAGELDEKLGDSLGAVREMEQAARLDPSEQNYFAWGSELLLHRAVWQAQEIFERGLKAYPKSARIETALGTALFGEARYEEAATRLCAASDLDPANPEPYLFMGRIGMVAPTSSSCLEEKLARFVREQPENSLANYLYAMTILKQQEQAPDSRALAQVEELLIHAVKDDAKCADGYLELGILQSSRRNFDEAIHLYSKAIEANPQLADAHYRLGVAYDRVGARDKAAAEFRLHDDLVKQQSAAVEAERREVKQFLVVLNGQAALPSTP